MELRDEDRERLAAVRWLPSVGPFAAFGRSWTVQTDEPDLAALVADLYADIAVEAAGAAGHADFRVVVEDGRPRSLVTRDDLRLGGGSAPSTTMGALVWGINRWVLDEASRDHLLLHAGGVVREDGLAVILPAPSGSGKSTLTTGLLDRGFAYLSDEAVEVLPDGTVRGYAKPVSLDRGAWGVLGAHQPLPGSEGVAYLEHQWHVRASRISRTVRGGSLRAIVFPRYSRTERPSLERLGPSQTLQRAGNCTFAPGNGRTVEFRQIQALAIGLAGVPAFELVSTDLEAACNAVLGVLEEHAGTAPSASR